MTLKSIKATESITPRSLYLAVLTWTFTAFNSIRVLVSGAWVFAGTRVPAAALFENLEDGAPVGQFIEWFPGVTFVQVRAVLEHAARSALSPVLWSAHKSR